MNKYLRLPAGGKGASIAPTAQSYRHATGTATTGTLVEPKASLWNRRADTLPGDSGAARTQKLSEKAGYRSRRGVLFQGQL